MADEGVYKGDSPGKKVARCLAWLDLLPLYGDRFHRSEGRVLFLAGDGGDASVLSAMGVPAAMMLAVDRSPESAERFAASWPGIDVRVGDVADVVENEEDDIFIAFLDFCGQLSRSNFETIRRVNNAMVRPGSTLMVGLMRGRENTAGQIDVLHGMNRMQRMIVRSRLQKWIGKKNGHMADVLQDLGRGMKVRTLIEAQSDSDSVRVDWSRIDALQLALDLNLLNEPVQPTAAYQYHSATGDTVGVPMLIHVFFHPGRGDEANELRDDYPYPNAFVVPSFPKFTMADIRRSVVQGEIPSRPKVMAYLAGNDEEMVELKALDVARLLNVPAGTAAAWRAHATRGTYTDS